MDRIYPTELQLNRANSSDTEAPSLDLNQCISNGTVSTKIYDKRDDFDIVNFSFLDGDVPRRKTNKHTKSKKTRSLFPTRGNSKTERTEKLRGQNMSRRKSPPRINHKATQSMSNTAIAA